MLSFAALTLALSVVSASPIDRRAACPSTAGDAPYSLPCATYEAAIINYTPGGAVNGSVLLVHGTGSSANESWPPGPYVKFLPKAAGVDVSAVNLPDNSLDDAQISAEYVAYAISYLAAKSRTGKIAIVGHSQGGGLNPQWALLYWPSKRALVTDYVALAGDYRGTPAIGLANVPLPQVPSQRQQAMGSNYLAAQNKRGNTDLLRATGGATTSIYSAQDEVVPNSSSPLPGAANFLLQDPAVCGNVMPIQADHFVMVGVPSAFALALDAITHDGPAVPSRIADLKQACLFLKYNAFGNVTDLTTVPALAVGSANAVGRILLGSPRTTVEPPLKPYVCAAGDATKCSS